MGYTVSSDWQAEQVVFSDRVEGDACTCNGFTPRVTSDTHLFKPHAPPPFLWLRKRKKNAKWQNPVPFGIVTTTQENPFKSYNRGFIIIFFLRSFKYWLKALTKCKSTVIPHGFPSTWKDQSWKFHFCSINIPAEPGGREGRGRGKEGRKVQAREEV